MTSRPALMTPARGGLRSQNTSAAATPIQSAAATGAGPMHTAPTSVGIADWVRYEYLLSRTGTTRSAKMLIRRIAVDTGCNTHLVSTARTATNSPRPPNKSTLVYRLSIRCTLIFMRRDLDRGRAEESRGTGLRRRLRRGPAHRPVRCRPLRHRRRSPPPEPAPALKCRTQPPPATEWPGAPQRPNRPAWPTISP